MVYRDLKPENVLLGLDGHAVLSDFGTAKRLSSSERTQEDGGSRGVPSTQTMIGTAEYMAPEARRRRRPPARPRRRRRRATTPRRPRLTHLPPRPPLHPQVLLGQPYSFAVDWWAAGVLLYEMLTGAPPSEKAFGRMTALEMQMEQLRARRAADGAAAAPATAMSEWWRRDGALPAEVREGAASLISGLLSPDPTARLGGSAAGGVSAIFSHEFFASVDWIALRQVRHRPRARYPRRRRPPARPRARARAARAAPPPRARAPRALPAHPLLLPSARAAVTPRDRPPRARPPPRLAYRHTAHRRRHVDAARRRRCVPVIQQLTPRRVDRQRPRRRAQRARPRRHRAQRAAGRKRRRRAHAVGGRPVEGCVRDRAGGHHRRRHGAVLQLGRSGLVGVHHRCAPRPSPRPRPSSPAPPPPPAPRPPRPHPSPPPPPPQAPQRRRRRGPPPERGRRQRARKSSSSK